MVRFPFTTTDAWPLLPGKHSGLAIQPPLPIKHRMCCFGVQRREGGWRSYWWRAYLPRSRTLAVNWSLNLALNPDPRNIKERIRPGTTGFLLTTAKDNSVCRNTAEALITCCPNRKVDMSGDRDGGWRRGEQSKHHTVRIRTGQEGSCTVHLKCCQ